MEATGAIITAIAITRTDTEIFCEAPLSRGFFLLIHLKLKNIMDRFRKEINVDKEPRLFEFVRIKNMSGVKFFITSIDSQQKPIACSLKETEEGKRKLVPGSLRWLYDIEGELSNVIREHQVKE